MKCWNKFSTGRIFHWAYLSFSLFFPLFPLFLSPFLFPSFSLFPFLLLSLAAVFLSHSHLPNSIFFLHLHRDRSLFIVWGIGALETFVCVTIKLTWSSIGLCNIPRRPNHSPPTPRPHWQLIGSQVSIAPFILCGWRPMSPSVPPETSPLAPLKKKLSDTFWRCKTVPRKLADICKRNLRSTLFRSYHHNELK